ncbi:MAG: undecaprenyl-diphosphate phosphatase, partial [Bacilli bacterium]|nr:undecaprenyl-diphosphate phosphatase [Bacilli bacterium]
MPNKFIELLKYLFLGLLQGIAEVLPISSSGHLQIANDILNIQDNSVSLSVFLHIASLIAVFIYLRK